MNQCIPSMIALAFLCTSLNSFSSGDDSQPGKPNIVYIMADELGYYEPAFMGGQNIRTPNLDRMAAEGIRFNHMLAGSSVCAPTRCCFLTGKHSGHTSVRSNGGGPPLRADEVTIASMLKPLGYATGGFGKWGNGGRDSTGVPEQHGFDVFLGYYDQVHAHTYYPPYLIRNSEEMPLAGNNGGSNGQTYSHYVIQKVVSRRIADLIDSAGSMANNVAKTAVARCKRPIVTEMPFPKHARAVPRVCKHVGHGDFVLAKQLTPLGHGPCSDAATVPTGHQSRACRCANRINVIVGQADAFTIKSIQIRRLQPGIAMARHIAIALVIRDDQNHVRS